MNIIEVAQRFLANQKWRSILNESLLDIFFIQYYFLSLSRLSQGTPFAVERIALWKGLAK